MKKYIYLIGWFVALFSSNHFYAQSSISVRAPAYFQNLNSLQPVELFVQPYTNACYLIPASDLAALTGSNITSLGIHFFIGHVNSVASGTIAMYLQNTADVSYSKGSNFSSCISGMTSVYSGTTSIAAVTATTDVICPLPSSFTYTGGGLYVAFSWTSGASSNIALYSHGASANSYGVNKCQSSNNAALNTMTTTAYRPTFVFGLDNTATNEASVEGILAPARVATGVEPVQTVKALVKNMSVNPLSNVQVSLGIAGSNSFSDVQTVPSIAPGAVTTVTFSSYSPLSNGEQTVTVTIPADQNPANNQKVMTQSLTCYQAGMGPAASGYGLPVGYLGILAGRFNFNRTSTMKTVRLAISSTGINDVVHGVLLDNNGVVLARTNTITVTNPMLYTFQSFSFAITQTLQANTDYYIGMALPISNLSTMGCIRVTDGIPGVTFGVLPLAGGTFSVGRPAYYGIEPVLNGSITVSPTNSIVCLNESFTLTPSGASTYSWLDSQGNGIANGNLETSLTNSAAFTIIGTTQTGCNAQGTTYLQVAACTGISEESGFAGLQLFPNPANGGRVTLSGLLPESQLTIYNSLGEQVFSATATTETQTLDLSGLPAGCYFLKAGAVNGEKALVKFVIGD